MTNVAIKCQSDSNIIIQSLYMFSCFNCTAEAVAHRFIVYENGLSHMTASSATSDILALMENPLSLTLVSVTMSALQGYVNSYLQIATPSDISCETPRFLDISTDPDSTGQRSQNQKTISVSISSPFFWPRNATLYHWTSYTFGLFVNMRSELRTHAGYFPSWQEFIYTQSLQLLMSKLHQHAMLHTLWFYKFEIGMPEKPWQDNALEHTSLPCNKSDRNHNTEEHEDQEISYWNRVEPFRFMVGDSKFTPADIEAFFEDVCAQGTGLSMPTLYGDTHMLSQSSLTDVRRGYEKLLSWRYPKGYAEEQAARVLLETYLHIYIFCALRVACGVYSNPDHYLEHAKGILMAQLRNTGELYRHHMVDR